MIHEKPLQTFLFNLSQLFTPTPRIVSECVKYDGKVQTRTQVQIVDGHCNCPDYRKCIKADTVAANARIAKY